MKFLANENFPGPSIEFLRNKGIEIIAIAQLSPGITDEQVMNFAKQEGLIILTHDSDYGELIFKYGFKPQEGVIYFRLFDFEPTDPGIILLQLLGKELKFKNSLTVVDEQSIRQRSY